MVLDSVCSECDPDDESDFEPWSAYATANNGKTRMAETRMMKFRVGSKNALLGIGIQRSKWIESKNGANREAISQAKGIERETNVCYFTERMMESYK